MIMFSYIHDYNHDSIQEFNWYNEINKKSMLLLLPMLLKTNSHCIQARDNFECDYNHDYSNIIKYDYN